MAKPYYSTVFEQKAADVWKIVRDFNSYPVWVGGAGESEIEGGRSGDSVGAVRNVLYRERRIRQRLLALSDVERSQSYEFCSAPSLPMTGFSATLRIRPSSTRPGVRRMVGDLRLRGRPVLRIDQDSGGLVRAMARIAPRRHGGIKPGFQLRQTSAGR
jgi:hypothetical protein